MWKIVVTSTKSLMHNFALIHWFELNRTFVAIFEFFVLIWQICQMLVYSLLQNGNNLHMFLMKNFYYRLTYLQTQFSHSCYRYINIGQVRSQKLRKISVKVQTNFAFLIFEKWEFWSLTTSLCHELHANIFAPKCLQLNSREGKHIPWDFLRFLVNKKRKPYNIFVKKDLICSWSMLARLQNAAFHEYLLLSHTHSISWQFHKHGSFRSMIHKNSVCAALTSWLNAFMNMSCSKNCSHIILIKIRMILHFYVIFICINFTVKWIGVCVKGFSRQANLTDLTEIKGNFKE